ncbi:MAG: hypothetical protein AAB554_02945 [Patescibacteria group bacterium]
MWLLHDVGYLLLFVAILAALALPPSALWVRRWNGAQEALKKSDPQAYGEQAYRARLRFDRVDMTIVIVCIVAAFVVLRRCMSWWGG